MKVLKLFMTKLRITLKGTPFKILNLPRTALKIVVNQMDIQSTLKLSKTSKKMYEKMKNAKRNVYKLIIDNHTDNPVGWKFPVFHQRIVILEKRSDVIAAYRIVQKCMDRLILHTYSINVWILWA